MFPSTSEIFFTIYQELYDLISSSTTTFNNDVISNSSRLLRLARHKPALRWVSMGCVCVCVSAGSCIQWGGRLNQGSKEWSSWNPGEARGCLVFWRRPPLGKPRCGGRTCQRSPPHRWALSILLLVLFTLSTGRKHRFNTSGTSSFISWKIFVFSVVGWIRGSLTSADYFFFLLNSDH